MLTPKTNKSKFPPDEDRLAKIKKTRENMADPPGVDFKEVVEESIDRFWKNRKRS